LAALAARAAVGAVAADVAVTDDIREAFEAVTERAAVAASQSATVEMTAPGSA
jgi:hypothetical protein